MAAQNRLLHSDWDLYDTRHAVFQPARLTVDQLEEGYWRAYRDFYSWPNIIKGAATKDTAVARARHVAYAAGWKKFERVWDVMIHARRLAGALPILESVLSGLGRVRPDPIDEVTELHEPAGQPVRLLDGRLTAPG